MNNEALNRSSVSWNVRSGKYQACRAESIRAYDDPALRKLYYLRYESSANAGIDQALATSKETESINRWQGSGNPPSAAIGQVERNSGHQEDEPLYAEKL